MRLILIAAHDPNLVIGKNGQLPWRYPEDLKHFKSKTLNETVIMGRGVFEELGEKPLPNRKNIVLSTSKTYDNVETFKSLNEAIENVSVEQLFVIGGGVLYKQVLPIADELIITEIKKEYEGDTFFPEYRNKIDIEWKETSRKETEELSFLEFKRIN